MGRAELAEAFQRSDQLPDREKRLLALTEIIRFADFEAIKDWFQDESDERLRTKLLPVITDKLVEIEPQEAMTL